MIVRQFVILGGLIWAGIMFGSYKQGAIQKVLVINNTPEEVIVTQWTQFNTSQPKIYSGKFQPGRQHRLFITTQAFITISSKSFGDRIIQFPIHPTAHTITISQQSDKERHAKDNLGNSITIWKPVNFAAKIINAWRSQS